MEFRRPSSLTDLQLGNGSVALAGGTDLVPLLRDGLADADVLVDVRGVVPRGVTPAGAGGGGGLRIGGATTLADLEASQQVPAVLREACRLAASPQLRNAGTIAGNLLQATRCWYWRLELGCWLQGGERCLARDGRSDEHAIFGNAHCGSAHPSDPAAALLALDATVRTDRRELPVAELYRLPTDDDRSLTALQPGELILDLQVPVPEASTYLKAMDRKRFSFPLVGVAAVRSATPASGVLRTALAGVAPVPWLLDPVTGLEDATPLPGAAFKVELARALVERAHRALASPVG